MSYAENRKDVIVINDSDAELEDIPPLASGGSVVLLGRTSGSRTPASFQSGKSEPGSRYTGPGPRSESQIRELLTGTSALGSHSRSDIGMIDETGADPGPVATLPRDIIEIDSDEFLDAVDGRPLKRARLDWFTPSPTVSTGFGYDAFHQHSSQSMDNKACMIQKVVHGSAVEPDYITPQWAWRTQKDFIWVTAQAQVHQRHQNSVLHVKKQSHFTVNPLVMHELASVSASFHMAGGAINRIIQKPGCVAISSATSGGQSDTPGATAQPQDLYNREGTLQFWQDNKSQSSVILHGHCVFEESQDQSERLLGQEVHESTCHKCYTVNGISFDPNQSHLMVSAGNNCTIQLWQDHKKLNNAYYKYPRAPYDVVYREKDSLLAVTCMNGSVFVHQTQWWCLLGDPVELHVVPPNVQHSVGAIIWGQGASADMLFASSESQCMDDFSGFHVALDPDQGRCVYKFNASESGDGMALDPDGARLALCTAALDGTHFLRIYDVHRRNGHATQEVKLNHFHADFPQSTPQEGEVTAVSFSPDGLFLAIARSDDEVHVYDSRFMGQGIGPMRRFLHWGDDCCMAGDKWGVVDAVWVNGWCGRGLGIVTGGSDGCVRFWDVRRSADDIQNGDVLAQPNSDIGHFSVGDPRNGEKPLVVGDNGGRVYVYDHATAC